MIWSIFQNKFKFFFDFPPFLSAVPKPHEGVSYRNHPDQIEIKIIFRTRGQKGLYLKRGLWYSGSKIAFRTVSERGSSSPEPQKNFLGPKISFLNFLHRAWHLEHFSKKNSIFFRVFPFSIGSTKSSGGSFCSEPLLPDSCEHYLSNERSERAVSQKGADM